MFSLLRILIFVFIFCFFSFCRKDERKTQWETELLVPLAYTTITINNIASDTLIEINNENFLSLVYRSSIYELALDSLYKIPDTTIVNTFTLPGYIQVPPGSQILNMTNEIKLQTTEAIIRKLIVRKGFARFVIRSSAKTNLIFKYTVPKATKNGIPFSISDTLLAAQNGQISEKELFFDISGYTFELTGSTGNNINSLFTKTEIKTDPNGPTVTFNQSDILQISNGFSNIEVYYALGTLGTKHVTIGPEVKKINFFRNIRNSNIFFEKLKLKLLLENRFGIDASVILNKIWAVNSFSGNQAYLNDPILNKKINITRASEISGNIIPSSYELTFSSDGTKPLIEILPDKVGYEIDITTNPLGNISGGNDFVYYKNGLKIFVDFELPLSLSTKNLIFTDTINFNFSSPSDIDNIQKATFFLIADNGFPFEATPIINLLDKENKLIATLAGKDKIQSAIYTTDNFDVTEKKRTYITLNSDPFLIHSLRNVKKIAITIVFTTIPQNKFVKLYNHHSIDLKLTAKFTYQVEQ